MVTIHSIRRAAVLVTCVFAVGYSLAAVADDMATFATGGYARGLRTKAMMHKIDTDGDGTVSHDEFIAYESELTAKTLHISF